MGGVGCSDCQDSEVLDYLEMDLAKYHELVKIIVITLGERV